MSLAQITLTTNKSVSNVGDFVRKIGQGERGQVLPVFIIDANGEPYDLTNKKLVFSENKDSGKYVVDDGQAPESGKFELTDAKSGKFNYTLQEQIYSVSGTAWFDIVSQDGNVLDTTNTFKFIVIPSINFCVTDDNYLSTIRALQAHYQAVIAKNETDIQQLVENLNDKIERVEAAKNEAIKEINDQRDAAIAQASTNFQGEIIKLNQDYSAWKSEKLADFTKSLQNLTTQIKTDQTNLTEFGKQLNDTKAEIEMLTKQLDSIDFAKNYFTKQEASDMKQNVLDTVGEQLKNKADNQSVIANQQRITALENAGYVKAKFDGFKSAEEARQWSEQNHGFSMFTDGQ